VEGVSIRQGVRGEECSRSFVTWSTKQKQEELLSIGRMRIPFAGLQGLYLHLDFLPLKVGGLVNSSVKRKDIAAMKSNNTWKVHQ